MYPNLAEYSASAATIEAVSVESGGGVFLHADMFPGLTAVQVRTMARLVYNDGQFRTGHYQLVESITRPDYERFRDPFVRSGWTYREARQYVLNSAGRSVARRLALI